VAHPSRLAVKDGEHLKDDEAVFRQLVLDADMSFRNSSMNVGHQLGPSLRR
jgi:hypothetical protein